MNKTKYLKIINPILALFFILQALTGMFHELIPHKAYEKLHGAGGLLLIIFGLVHIYLNWGWITTNVLGIK